MERFNLAMQDIQADGSLEAWLEKRGREMRGREWARLVDVVHDQAYARVVGPYSHELEVCSIFLDEIGLIR
jgi:H3 lysine-79-specific histone-lysine N-methyltransferase